MPRHKKNEAAPTDALQAKLDEVRASRATAAAAGSHGSVSAMHRLEFDIVRAMWEREAAEAAAKRKQEEEDAARADPFKLIEDIKQAVLGMPAPLRDRLLSELGALGSVN